MSTTTKQDKDFADTLIGEVRVENSALETAIDWVKDNLRPEDVFEEKDLLKFAAGFSVSDVFPEKDLQYWAENNGYIKE